MKNMINPIFSFVLLFVLLGLLWSSATAQEVEDQKEFSYIKGSENGPAHWGDLNRSWTDCKKGKMQSPIDLLDRRVGVVRRFGRLNRNYKPSCAVLKNRGHDIKIKWEGDAGSIQIKGTDYALQQCHWHSPSEHTLHGKKYAMELHMVHQSLDNKTAVVGVLYLIGQSDPFLSELMSKIKDISDTKEMKDAGIVDPRHVKIDGEKFYRYTGSLTTPPCTEGVIWTINKRVRTVSLKQVRLLRDAVHDYAENNARPLQPINEREIYFYGPQPEEIKKKD